MADPALLVLALIGVVLSLIVHVGAWFEEPLPFFGLALLMLGCFVVWGRALRRARLVFSTNEPRALWSAVMAQCPPWVGRSYVPLVIAVTPFWLVVMHRAVLGDGKVHEAEFARMMSLFALVFYFYGGAFLWASLRNALPRREGDA